MVLASQQERALAEGSWIHVLQEQLGLLVVYALRQNRFAASLTAILVEAA